MAEKEVKTSNTASTAPKAPPKAPAKSAAPKKPATPKTPENANQTASAKKPAAPKAPAKAAPAKAPAKPAAATKPVAPKPAKAPAKPAEAKAPQKPTTPKAPPAKAASKASPEKPTETKTAPAKQAAPKKPEAPKKPKEALEENKKVSESKVNEPQKEETAKADKENPAKADKKPEADKKPQVDKKTSAKAPKKSSKKQDGESAAVDDKNLEVVEKALSVEELDQLKKKRIRNATYAMLALVLVALIVLIIIIFWPTEEKVEAQYDLTLNSVPDLVEVTHEIYDVEVDGTIITFKKPITLENPTTSEHSGLTAFAVKVEFLDDTGADITDKMFIRLNDQKGNDIYNLENIREATIGELENVPDKQIYVDLAKETYIYYNNIITKGQDPYEILLGFMCKDISVLENKVDMKVTIYVFDGENLDVQQTVDGKQITAKAGVKIPAPDEWIENIKNNVNQMQN